MTKITLQQCIALYVSTVLLHVITVSLLVSTGTVSTRLFTCNVDYWLIMVAGW